MKRAVSISIGSSKRDKKVEIELFGEKILLERIGTDGDMQKAARMFVELDGKVDALGVGGSVLGFMVDNRWHPLHSALPLVRGVCQTPVVDGTGLKLTVERKVAKVIEEKLGGYVNPKRAFVVMAIDRLGTTQAFLDGGYECIFGDLMFSLGVPIPVRSEAAIKLLGKLLIPIVGRLPFEWVYPIGETQEIRKPKWEKYFNWATVVSGDCHYIWRYMPERMDGKVIVTNTTTPEDVAFFRQAGVKYLITTTPVLDGRTFGTNMMEAAIVAAWGRKEPVDYSNPGSYFEEIEAAIHQLGLTPQVQEL
ncbi:MAG: hypothetical protein U1B80_03010 [Anaerolineaceae bacterium]|nr:hypothetical protein [Anaerolineaceae bacterium]